MAPYACSLAMWEELDVSIMMFKAYYTDVATILALSLVPRLPPPIESKLGSGGREPGLRNHMTVDRFNERGCVRVWLRETTAYR